MLRDRREAHRDLIRQQAELLMNDARHSAAGNSAEDTVTLGPEQQPFNGTFRITTQRQDSDTAIEVEYSDEQGKVIGRWRSPPMNHE
jgi:hypothetical protein